MPQLKITVTDEIYKQLQDAADRECRSLSGQAAYMLKQYFTLIPAPTPTTPQFIPHDIPGGMPTQPPFEPTATAEIQLTTEEKLAAYAEQIKEESPEPITKPRKFQRPDGEPFTIEDFEQYLTPGTTEDDTYRTLKKKIPSLQFTTILREGASRPLDDFVKYLKEEYMYTLENALDYSPAQTMPSATLKALAGYLQPHIS